MDLKGEKTFLPALAPSSAKPPFLRPRSKSRRHCNRGSVFPSQKLALRSCCSTLYLRPSWVFGGFFFGLRRPQIFQMAYFAGFSPPISIDAVQNDLFWAMLLLSKPTDLTLQAGAPFSQNPKKGLEIRFELFIGHWLHMPSPGFSKSITSLTQLQTPFQVRRGEGEI